MSRVKIIIPDKFIFQTDYHVTINDINYGNHVGNDRFLGINNEVRIRWFKSMGFKDELSFGDTIGTMVADAALQFKSEAFYGDALSCKVGVDNIHSRGFDMINLLVRDEDIVCVIKTAILFVNYSQRKLAPVPEVFFDRSGLEKP